MTGVPLGLAAFNRTYGDEPEIQLVNRFLEVGPTNQVEKTVLLSKPGNTFEVSAGGGPIRQTAHQEGVFDDDLFFVSDDALFRWDGTTATQILGTVNLNGNPSITFSSGAGFEFLFIADGTLLQFYDGTSFAKQTLTISVGNIIATDTVTVDAAVYEYTAGSVDAGDPMGTVGDPYLVALGASDTDALANLVKALNLSGVAGTDYSTATQINVNVEGLSSDATTLVARARVRGAAGNSIPVDETGANMAWGDVTLLGGGTDSLSGVITPDDVGIVSLATIASFVVAVHAQSRRFSWLQPGAIIIDALDFAEAERKPDEIIEAVTVGDQLYILCSVSTEVWYVNPSTDPTGSNFLRQQGLAFSQGALSGTIVPIKTNVFVVANDGIVYTLAGGPKRISTNGIEERIRLSREAEGI